MNKGKWESPLIQKIHSHSYSFITIACLILTIVGWKRKQPLMIYICSCLQILKAIIVNLDLDDRAQWDFDNWTLTVVINAFIAISLTNALGSNFQSNRYRQIVFFILPAVLICSVMYGISLNLTKEGKALNTVTNYLMFPTVLIFGYTGFCQKLISSNQDLL